MQTADAVIIVKSSQKKSRSRTRASSCHSLTLSLCGVFPYLPARGWLPSGERREKILRRRMCLSRGTPQATAILGQFDGAPTGFVVVVRPCPVSSWSWPGSLGSIFTPLPLASGSLDGGSRVAGIGICLRHVL